MLKDILKRLKPTPEEEKGLEKKVSVFLKALNKNLEGAKAVLGGSFAKGTWLAGNHDVDVFVVFEKEGKVSDLLEKSLKRSFKNVERVHGSRDYFQVPQENVTFEIIPVLKIKKAEEAKNVTDVSLLHVKWVKRHITPELADQIRLAKQFFKAQKIYGAETFIKGFSGYVTEILIIHYGSFLKFLKHAVDWHHRKVIDPEGHGGDLKKHKDSMLTIIDPVQPTRNAAAAVSEERFLRLVKAGRSFIQEPSEKSFVIKPIKLEDLKGKDLILEATPLEGKRDLIGTKFLKVFEYFLRRCKEEGFILKEKDWDWNGKAYFWFKVKEKKLSKTYKHHGPPLTKKKHLEEFRKKHKGLNLKEEKGKVFVVKQRKFIDFDTLVKAVLKDAYVKSRVKRIKKV